MNALKMWFACDVVTKVILLTKLVMRKLTGKEQGW